MNLSMFFTQASQVIQRSMQQSVLTEMESVLSTESFKVNCCSVLKEMAVSCDLTDMEKVWDLLTVDRRILTTNVHLRLTK